MTVRKPTAPAKKATTPRKATPTRAATPKKTSAPESVAAPAPRSTLEETRALLAKRNLTGPLAASALHLAAVLDGTQSTTGSAAVSRELRAVLAELLASAPATAADPVDELSARRSDRRGA